MSQRKSTSHYMKRLKRNKKRVILGVTGTFGSGKSTVANMFKSFGAELIDADKIAHRVIRPGSEIYKKIINAFSRSILKKNKTIDRKKIAKVVFKDKKLLQKLNRIIHPEVIKIIENQICASTKDIVVLDAPLLIEAGLERLVDKLIVVSIHKKKQIERALKKASLSEADILKRIKAQIPLKDKIRLADFVIDNNGTIKATKKQIQELRRKLWIN